MRWSSAASSTRARKAFATPRRLALHIAGLPVKGEGRARGAQGPRVGSPEGAIQGFLKGAGLTSHRSGEDRERPEEGRVLRRGDREARPLDAGRAGGDSAGHRQDLPVAEIHALGRGLRRARLLRWVRPLHSILCTFGPETEDPEIVRFEVDGTATGDVTQGHRFLAPGEIRVKRFDDYAPALERAKVVIDTDRRKDMILHDAKDLAFAQGLELIEDEGLLEEVAGLVEWPVVLMGSFDEAFLDIPPEVIRTTIRANQKCFVLRDPEHRGKLANKFHPRRPTLVARPTAARPSSAATSAWCARACPMRNSSGRQDRKVQAGRAAGEAEEHRLPREARHAIRARRAHRGASPRSSRRLSAPILNSRSAPRVSPRPISLTEMVGEFPELQGLMGRYYASLQGEHASVAAAVEEHYKPLGPSDRVPTDPVSVAVALADKIDTLVGFWAIDEKPTGSKDPCADSVCGVGVTRSPLKLLTTIVPRTLEIPILRNILLMPGRFSTERRYETNGC